MYNLKPFAPIVLALVAASTGACNTTRGMGEDVEAAGEAVQDAAQNTEDKLQKK